MKDNTYFPGASEKSFRVGGTYEFILWNNQPVKRDERGALLPEYLSPKYFELAEGVVEKIESHYLTVNFAAGEPRQFVTDEPKYDEAYHKLYAALIAAPAEPEATAEPEVPAEPETPVEPEPPVETETPSEPETPAEPEIPAEPEVPAEPAVNQPDPEVTTPAPEVAPTAEPEPPAEVSPAPAKPKASKSKKKAAAKVAPDAEEK